MKKLIGKLSHKALGIFPMLALMLAVSSAQSACFFWSYQPDVPEELTCKG